MIPGPRVVPSFSSALLLGLFAGAWLGCASPSPSGGEPDAGRDAGSEEDAGDEELPEPTGAEATWSRQFGTSEADDARAVTEDAEGNIIVGGSLGGWPAEDGSGGVERRAFVRKYDPSGTELWTVTFESSLNRERWCTASTLTTDAAGNIYVGGYEERGFVRKLSAEGELLWSTVLHEDPREDQVRSVRLDATGDLWVVALLDTSWLGTYQEGGTRLQIARLGSDGEVVSSEEIALEGSEYMLAASIGPTGQVAVAGGRGMNSPVAFVARLAPDGTRLWTQQIASDRTSVANAVALDDDGEVAVTGFFFGSLPDAPPQGGTANAFVRRFDPEGNPRWTEQILAGGTVEGRAVALGPEGETFVGGTRLMLEVYTAEGAGLWTSALTQRGGGSAYAMSVGPSGRLLVAGGGSFTDRDDHADVEALLAVFDP